MSCRLYELYKDNIMNIIDRHVEVLEDIKKEAEDGTITDSDTREKQLGKITFAILSVKSIKADIKELDEY